MMHFFLLSMIAFSFVASAQTFIFDNPQRTYLHNCVDFSTHRLIADFNGDGISDMAEIFNTAKRYFTRRGCNNEWNGGTRMNIFHGRRHKRTGRVSFPHTSQAPIKMPLTGKGVRGNQTELISESDFVLAGDFNLDSAADIALIKINDDEESGSFFKVNYLINTGLKRSSGKGAYYQAMIPHTDAPGHLGLGSMLTKWAKKLGLTRDEVRSYVHFLSGNFDGKSGDDIAFLVKGCKTQDHGKIKIEDCDDVRAKIFSMTFWTGKLTHKAVGEASLPGLLDSSYILTDWTAGRSLDELKVGDLNGDGIDDITVVYDMHGSKVAFRYALATGNASGMFTLNRANDFDAIEIEVSTPLNLGFSVFESRDMMDINGDGCDDYIHVGEYKRVPVMTSLTNMKCKAKLRKADRID